MPTAPASLLLPSLFLSISFSLSFVFFSLSLSLPVSQLVVQCLYLPAGIGPVSALISCSALLQERPLREQQEVAAAVIQRCYRKYKQVSWPRLTSFLTVPGKLVQISVISHVVSVPYKSSFHLHPFQAVILNPIKSVYI